MAIVDIKDKIRGSLIGGAIGDALGYQIEFDIDVKPKQATRFRNDLGVISDDTQMTLFTACALLWRATRWHLRGIALLPPEAIYLGYLDWLGTQQRVNKHRTVSWIKNIPELNVLRNPGSACIESLSSGRMGTLGQPINNSKGCGGIMRIAPIPLCSLEPVVGDFSAKSCAITHGHPLAALSAFVLSYVIFYAVRDDISIEDAAKIAIKKMERWTAEGVDADQKLVKLKYSNEKLELTRLLHKAMRLGESGLADQEAISLLGNGWTADEALAIALYCSIKHEHSFKDAIVAAANHDGDSDSTAAITGNIVGAKLGYKNIPDYYKNHIELREVILELADDMASGVPQEEYDATTGRYQLDKKWLAKYAYLD